MDALFLSILSQLNILGDGGSDISSTYLESSFPSLNYYTTDDLFILSYYNIMYIIKYNFYKGLYGD